MDIRERRDILITCGPSLKDYLQAEIESLGFDIINTHAGGVLTRGSFIDCMKLNFSLRTAYNVLYLLRQFRCGSTEALYKQIGTLPWEKIIDPKEHLCVLSRVDTWSVSNSMYPNLKVKDAIVDRIHRKAGARPDSGPDRNGVVVNLFWKDDKAWIYLNTSGVKLSDRNYRKMPYKAPLRESLAAGIIIATGYDGSQELILPMCGSGTLAIEAALIAMNKPAGALRNNFGFKHVKGFDEQIWEELRRDISKTVYKDAIQKRIIATDINEQAIRAATQNARTAGVEHLIDFDVCDFADTELPTGKGIIVINPEYGWRLGELERLGPEYKRIGDFLKQRCAGHTAYLLIGNKELSAKIGLKASRRFVFYNGNIECRLLKYELYKGTKSPRGDGKQ
ncbi:MAG: THUMP domain-containing class I SAM-dependent RNA methyltransferase [Planctomycetota bacterium]|jgi:putative N6-adenine-specific DNA methylase